MMTDAVILTVWDDPSSTKFRYVKDETRRPLPVTTFTDSPPLYYLTSRSYAITRMSLTKTLYLVETRAADVEQPHETARVTANHTK